MFVILETAINFILWKQFIFSVLQRKGFVRFANIC